MFIYYWSTAKLPMELIRLLKQWSFNLPWVKSCQKNFITFIKLSIKWLYLWSIERSLCQKSNLSISNVVFDKVIFMVWPLRRRILIKVVQCHFWLMAFKCDFFTGFLRFSTLWPALLKTVNVFRNTIVATNWDQF